MKTNYLNLLEDKKSHINKVLKEIEGKEKVILYFHGGLSSKWYMKFILGPLLLKTIFSEKILDPQTHVVFMQYNAGIFSKNSYRKFYKRLRRKKYWRGFEAYINELSESPFSGQEDTKKMESILEENSGIVKKKLRKIERFLSGYSKLDSVKSYPEITALIERIVARKQQGTDHGEVTLFEEVLRIKMGHFQGDDIPQKHWKKVYDHAEGIWENKKGRLFLEGLNRIYDHSKSIKAPLLIDVISHSAGSIPIAYLFNTLSKNQEFNIKVNNVLLIVPAVRIQVFQQYIYENKHLFKTFKMYLLDDESEVLDELISNIYTRSMLYFASGVAEIDAAKGDMPLLGMHRYYKEVLPYTEQAYNTDNGVFGNIAKCKTFLMEEGKDRMIFVSQKEEVMESFGMRVITTTGASHSCTKKPTKSIELAIDLVFYLTEENVVLTPADCKSLPWVKAGVLV